MTRDEAWQMGHFECGVYRAIGFGNRIGRITTGLPAAVPTLSEWAMILFGLMLAGGAALMIQRRQMAA